MPSPRLLVSSVVSRLEILEQLNKHGRRPLFSHSKHYRLILDHYQYIYPTHLTTQSTSATQPQLLATMPSSTVRIFTHITQIPP
jgi:hypothetical protein